MDRPLAGRVALVTGGSRGVGRGVALGLGEAGATVYITGRTVQGRHPDLPQVSGSLEETAAEVTALGGMGVPVPCDHRDDAQVRAVVERIGQEHGRLDVLVNNVWGGYEGLHRWDERGQRWQAPFWEQPLELWDDMFVAGVRAHYVASALCAPLLIGAAGLVVNISFFAGQRHHGQENIPYFLAKNADDQMARAMANHLRPHGVTAVSLYPGWCGRRACCWPRRAPSISATRSRLSSWAGRWRRWRATRSGWRGRGRCWWRRNWGNSTASRTWTAAVPARSVPSTRRSSPARCWAFRPSPLRVSDLRPWRRGHADAAMGA
ncbi:SDR family NAD(P)-dependent oxidoreductase [Deinococcus metalli]|uniref:SDR family NAD(P)-dependent oxidoreductase n=1 Tax=Deinococcus metalli TaxID=1141878 RepID=UPI003615915B